MSSIKIVISMLFGTLLLLGPAQANPFDQRIGSNRIEGTVWDASRRPVPDVYVELYNATDGDLARTRTAGSGRFTFVGLTTGRFRVKVVTAGTNLLEESQDVEILGTGLANSNETRYVDFYLKLDPKRASASLGPPEAVFVQDVPNEARKLYKKGLEDIKSDKGLELVESAIKAFPDYFDALAAAGKEYVERGNFIKGAKYLVPAVRINERSHTAYSSLAYAAYKLNMIPEAIKAAQAAVALAPTAFNTRILFARLLRMNGSYKAAEQLLLDTRKMDANLPQVCYELALVYNRQNRNDEAAQELTAYLKLVPAASDKKEVEELIAKLKEAK